MTNDLQLLHRARSPKRHAHSWGFGVCIVCDLTLEEYMARSRRSRNNRSRGGRAELAVAREYGGEKVGPLGLGEDIRGKLFATQVKVSQRSAPPMWLREFAKLANRSDGRTPRLILRFTRQGGLATGRTEDFVVIRGSDWLDHWGKDE